MFIMKKIFMAVAFLFAFTLMTTVHAENWVNLGADNFGDQFFIDADSVTLKSTEGDVKTFHAAFKTEFTDEWRNAAKNPAHYIISVCAFNNKDGKKFIASVSSKIYGAEGLIGSDDLKSPWQEIPQGSIGEVMYDHALKYLK